MSIVIVIDENGLDIENDELRVHIAKDLSFAYEHNIGEAVIGPDIRDLIDVAKLVEPVLTEKYGGYR